MSVPLTLLGLLHREPSHGYDLKRDYDAYFGRERPLPFGQVYATLTRLARDGKVVPGVLETGQGPDRKRYVITDVGKRDVESWLDEPIGAGPDIQTPALRQGRPGLDAGAIRGELSRRATSCPSGATAGTDRAQTHGRLGGCVTG